MTKITNSTIVAALLSFNGGFVDTAGYLGLAGLFTAHVTGNFVTLGAALVHGSHGIVGKILALPEFIAVIALARFAGTALRALNLPAMQILLGVKVALLLVFFVLAVRFGPFPDANTPMALLTGFAGVGAMAMQNAVQRVHMASLPPSTMMTGSTVQVTLDAVDLMTGAKPESRPQVRTRFSRLALAICFFALGCAVAAVMYVYVGFWCLAVSVVVGLAASVIRIEEAAPA
ncbi:hypothetical protein CSIRO_4118 [Bradyrhizobiaceae bacterium SG-6C]|nr:hypothetical protein CSIRO_4118 [Bradyrhizobiaceae bacterium SG-6C]